MDLAVESKEELGAAELAFLQYEAVALRYAGLLLRIPRPSELELYESKVEVMRAKARVDSGLASHQAFALARDIEVMS